MNENITRMKLVGNDVQGRIAFTAVEAAKMLAVSPRTLWSLTKRGEIRAKKIGRSVRYYLLDLITYMERGNNSGQHQQ
jgi:excisionase family DNA binding protein